MTTPTANPIFSLCYVRSSWADPWVQVPLLECLSVGNRAAPAHAEARFSHHYGHIRLESQIGTRAAGQFVEPKTDFKGYYVRVVTADWMWFGVIVDRVDERDEDVTLNAVVAASGVESYVAFGLTHLLDQMSPIRTAVVYDKTEAVAANRRKVIGKPLVFNGALLGDQQRPNKYKIPDPIPAPEKTFEFVFVDTGREPLDKTTWLHADDVAASHDVEHWTAEDVIRYLFTWFTSRDSGGADLLGWSVDAPALDYIVEPMAIEGLTIWQALNRLLPRGQGLGFTVVVKNIGTITGSGPTDLAVTEVSPVGAEYLEVKVFTFVPVTITFPGGTGQLPANTNQGSLNLGGFVNVQKLTVTESDQSVFDQVLVLGEYRGTVCTLAKEYVDPNVEGVAGHEIGGVVLDDELAVRKSVCVERWTTAEADAFSVGRSADADFAALSDEAKGERQQLFRRDDTQRHVFAQWEINPDWSRKLPYDNDVLDNNDNTVTTVNEVFVFPKLEENGTVSTTEEQFQLCSALVVADYLPMMTHVDYGEDGPYWAGGGGVVNQTEVFGDLLRPQVWFDYRLGEHLDLTADVSSSGRQWNVQSRVLEDVAGLEFRVSGGRQEFIAEDLFAPEGSFEWIFVKDHGLNHDAWIATVYLISQERIAIRYPDNATVNAAAGDRIRVFEVAMPQAHFDLILAGTVVGVDFIDTDTGPGVAMAPVYRRSKGGTLRDSRDLMRTMAESVWSYVGQSRNILQLSYTASGVAPEVGFLFTTVGGGGQDPVTLNTVVTDVQIDLRSGDVRLATQAAEIDFAGAS